MDPTVFPPGPTTWSPLGHLFPFAQKPLDFLVQLARDYGDIAHFRIRRRHIYLFNHPDLIEGVLVTHHRNFVKNPGFRMIEQILGQGLLTSEGEFHLQQRRLIQPAFHRRQLAQYGEIMVRYAARRSASWQDGQTIDLAQEMTRLALAIVGQTLFSAEVEAEAGEVSQALDQAMTLFHSVTSPLKLLLTRLPWGKQRFERGRDRLDAAIYRIINARRVDKREYGDVLSLLLLAQADTGNSNRMTDQQVRDEALTLFLAGYETTAVALTWTWYLLAQHPGVEAELHAELETVLGGRLPTADDLPHLHYTWMVITEAIRLYPPIYMIGRQALNDYPVRDYVIPAEASILMSPYTMQHDPRYFAKPETFDPWRWRSDSQAQRPKFAYFPFGGGPRVCIGEPFAMQEAMLVVAILAQQWRMRLPPGSVVAMEPRVTLRPKNGLPLTLVRRNKAQKIYHLNKE